MSSPKHYQHPPPTPPSLIFTNQLLSDYHSLIDNDQLSDASLRGTDGIEIPVVKAILSIRSTFFSKLFFGGFAEETSSGVIDIGFDSDVLRSIVCFFYTGSVRYDVNKPPTVISHSTTDVESTACPTPDEGEVRLTIRLIEAAHYFDLTELEIILKNSTYETIQYHPSLSCAIIDEIERLGNKGPLSSCYRLAWDTIRSEPAVALFPPPRRCAPVIAESRHDDEAVMIVKKKEQLRNSIGSRGVAAFDESLMEQFMMDDTINADEYTMFLCLETWAEEDDTLERRDHARRFARDYLELTRILPSHLANVVSLSPLVDATDILNARAVQSLVLEREGVVRVFRELTQAYRSTFAGGTAVTVEGAGMAEVNGVYHLSGWSSGNGKNGPAGGGSPEFSRVGMWKGDKCCFRLSRLRPVDWKWRWYIVIQRSAGQWTFFYASSAVEKEQGGCVIPYDTWSCGKKFEGKKPNPVVLSMSRHFQGVDCNKKNEEFQ